MRARLLAVTLDLLPPAFVAGAGDSPSLLHGRIRLCALRIRAKIVFLGAGGLVLFIDLRHRPGPIPSKVGTHWRGLSRVHRRRTRALGSSHKDAPANGTLGGAGVEVLVRGNRVTTIDGFVKKL